jgi:hypothetical protein
MTQPVTALLRTTWEYPTWRDEVLAAFDRWVEDGVSRNDVKSKLKVLIGIQVTEQADFSLDDIDQNQINWDQLVEFLCTCYYRKRLHSPLPDIPSDDLWVRLTDPHTWGPLSLHPQQDKAIKETVPVPLFPLEQKLLNLGGVRLIFRYEPDLKPLLERGEPFDEPVELVPGDLHQCHRNVAQLWNDHRNTLAIVTGYELSEDGYWRQHSWLRQEKPAGQYHLLETTSKRVKYFGMILTETEAERFYQYNGI